MDPQPDFDPATLEDLLGGPVTIAPVASGQSNPTWFVDRGDRRLVLRKKPLGATLASAHAVDREYRVMHALADSGVPVPRMVMLDDTPDRLGTPFYIMERLDGAVSDESALPGHDPGQRAAIYDDTARVLARLHGVDWAAAGLSDFGRHSGYYARQVRRWSRQWTDSRTREDAEIDALTDWFAANIPADSAITIVHGDYRIGNLMIAPDGRGICGVLDWELSTLGDPLADLAHLMMFWSLTPDQLGGLNGLPLADLGLPEAQAFLDRYRAAGGTTAELTPFHRAFAFYRMSVIFEGITARALAGQAAHADAMKVGALAPACARIAADILSSDRKV
jgi:aminoglycoside phosphotransferase (APT) family kinase protein